MRLPRTSAREELSIPRLRAALNGRVIAPDDAGYDEARTVFYGGFDRRPAVIVRVADAADVARVVTLARETGTRARRPQRRPQPRRPRHLATAGSCSTCRDMRALEIDAERTHRLGRDRADGGRVHERDRGRTAWRPGSATPARSGSAGITLGGGVGYLVRKYGLTIDDLLAAEVVTADGQLAAARTRRRIPISSGRSAAAGATSASPPASSSGCTRLGRSSAGC